MTFASTRLAEGRPSVQHSAYILDDISISEHKISNSIEGLDKCELGMTLPVNLEINVVEFEVKTTPTAAQLDVDGQQLEETPRESPRPHEHQLRGSGRPHLEACWRALLIRFGMQIEDEAYAAAFGMIASSYRERPSMTCEEGEALRNYFIRIATKQMASAVA